MAFCSGGTLHDGFMLSTRLLTDRVKGACSCLVVSSCFSTVLCMLPAIPPAVTTLIPFQACHGQRNVTLSSHPSALTPSDTLPDRPHPHHRYPEDLRLFRKTEQIERHCGFHGGHTPHTLPVAFDGLPRRVVRHIRPLRRLFCDHCFLRREYTCGRTILTDGTSEDIQWSEKC